MTEQPLLEIDDVSLSFGGVTAVKEFSLTLPEHGRVAIIGPNGAGKSTLINIICGSVRPDHGEVRFQGRDVRRLSAQARARIGMARTFQNLELFRSMSVLDNVLTSLDSSAGRFGVTWSFGNGRRRRAQAQEMLELFDIDHYANVPVGALPYGVRKLVELSRALVTHPPLLLLDEPVAGLSDTGEFVATLVRALDQQQSTVLLIEHDMSTVQAVCSEVHVLDSGAKIAHGSFAQVSRDPRVIESYLGAATSQ